MIKLYKILIAMGVNKYDWPILFKQIFVIGNKQYLIDWISVLPTFITFSIFYLISASTPEVDFYLNKSQNSTAYHPSKLWFPFRSTGALKLLLQRLKSTLSVL